MFEKLGSEGTSELQIAYLIGAGVMAIGGIVELFLGVRAEKEQLEDIAKPISVEEAEREEGDAGAREDDAEADRESRRRARLERQRRGARRYRPGPGISYSPFIGAPAPRNDPWLDSEVEMIRWALEEGGEADRVELAKRVGARNWGPGRFTRALREAVAEGLVRKIGRHRFAPAHRRSPGGTASV